MLRSSKPKLDVPHSLPLLNYLPTKIYEDHFDFHKNGAYADNDDDADDADDVDAESDSIFLFSFLHDDDETTIIYRNCRCHRYSPTVTATLLGSLSVSYLLFGDTFYFKLRSSLPL